MATTLAIDDTGITIVRGGGQDGVPGGAAGGSPVDNAASLRPHGEDYYPARQPGWLEPLRKQVQQMINELDMPQHQRGMAMAKLEELLFWVNAGAQRTGHRT
jgi:hypothetical protein